MRFAWLTDIHLNFLDENERQIFYREIVDTQSDGVLISGDIAEANSIEEILAEMANHIKKPIYFILGNHDYYRGKITDVRTAMTAFSKANPNLFWIPAAGIQKLNDDVFLVGQDGWADGRYGDFENTRVVLNDSRMIEDLFHEKILGKNHLLEKMRELADADAMTLKNDLLQAIAQNPKKIIVLTHVPPFREVCMHKGERSNDDWLPFFASKVTGDVFMEIAEKYPAIEFLIFCGHTHSEAKHQPINNLIVEAGRAEYYHPEIQKIILI